MKLPNWVRVIWWFVLVGFFIYLVIGRYDSIISGAANAMDIVIFLILIALVTIPLFQEVSIFGVSLRKEIANLRSEFEKQIISLKSEIQSTINIYPPTPPTDSQLSSIEERIRPILEQTLKERGIEPPAPTREVLKVPDDTDFLFSVRYTIENELRCIWQYLEVEMRAWAGQDAIQPGILPRTVLQMASGLAKIGIIRPELASLIRDVHAISSSAIHGEKPSETAVSFVRDVASGLIASLKAIKQDNYESQTEE